MQLPEPLSPFYPQAKKLLEQGRVKHVEFSGATYQIQVDDPVEGPDIWAFIQLDPKGKIKDCFCSCAASEIESLCVHLATAFLKIYEEGNTPLHQRFERSLWNKLFRLYADRMGVDSDVLKERKKGHFFLDSAAGKTVFYIKTKTPTMRSLFREILFHRKSETEETSLKFSNLSQEEIILWREGRPNPQLNYELSFWSDLAKVILQLQEEKNKYKISFEMSRRGFPNFIHASFAAVELGFYLSEANLPKIIPALNSVDSPLKVHNSPQETIEKITYDKKNKQLEIHGKKEVGLKASIEGIPLSGWVFVPNDGFYVQDEESLLSKSFLKGKEITTLLNEHKEIVEALSEGITIHNDSVEVSYAIAFDPNWDLHITCYLFSEGDLTTGDSAFFHDWVYIDDDGFYKIENLRFDEVETVIPQNRVAEFVSEMRTWLNTFEGFQTYITSLEAQMSYTVDREGNLSFGRFLPLNEESKDIKEFGNWVYILGQGFFSKIASTVGLPLRPGMLLSKEQIPLFIRANREELHLVPNFFSERCPMVKSQLSIELTEEEEVVVRPIYDLDPEYKDKEILSYDDFIFVRGEGFSELPAELRLPDRFKHPVHIEKESLSLFLTYELVTLRRYAPKVDPRLNKPDNIYLVTTTLVKDPEIPGNYLLKLKYQTKEEAVPVPQLWQAMKDKKRFFFGKAGLFDLNEKRFNWLKLLSKNQIDKRKGTVRLSTLELLRLNAFEEITLVKGTGEDFIQAKNLLEELTLVRVPEEPNLNGLKSDLRPYQILGVRWLWFLYHHDLSGLLCDDMGLGKTHQAMALIAAICNKKKGTPLHFLVVCPTSVIYHWQEKLQAFLPNLRVCTFHGSSRSFDDFHKQYDILLTSYGIWRIENELLSEVKFELAIFDEVQIAKNHASRIFATLLNTKAGMRLGMTGTPIENHLRELKSLFDIVLPTYMPPETDYRELFIKPIEKEGSNEQKKLLHRLIYPFILRRKKGDVLLDLPEKTEEISHCELTPEQEKLYVEVLTKSRKKILDELQDEKSPIPYLHIFALLSSLKQICNHPAVFLKEPLKYKEYTSGKWDLFLELLSESRESEQKVVVFSQYLFQQDIIEEYLKETGIGFAAIRGSTQNRSEQIKRFNHDPDCEVFVGSLLAAGLGIDLTAASVVVHYDRWWNAARENQATDRVHRIGQTRGVQVFKLVTKNTFEEKIDAMILKKGKLMEDIVGVDDQEIIKQFTREEFIHLLQYGDQFDNL